MQQLERSDILERLHELAMEISKEDSMASSLLPLHQAILLLAHNNVSSELDVLMALIRELCLKTDKFSEMAYKAVQAKMFPPAILVTSEEEKAKILKEFNK